MAVTLPLRTCAYRSLARRATLIFAACAGGLALISAPAAGADDGADLPALTRQLAATAFAPGASAVELTAAGTRSAAAGYRDLKARTPMRPDTRIRAGSVTKTFTAVVVLQLVAKHKLALADPVEKWLPGVFRNGARITLRQLLNHTGGIYNYTRDPAVRRTWGTDHVPSPARLVAIAAAHPAEFAPGSGWSYSNTGYQALGLIIEKATGQTLAQQMRRLIFEPLRLASTALVPQRDIPGPHAQGYYRYRHAPSLNVTRTTLGAWADGALVSDAGDIARFYQALFTGKLLRPAQLRELKRTVPTGGFPDGDQAGLGIFRTRLSCGVAWGNSGGVAGFLTKVLLSPDGRRVVAFTTNGFLDEGPDTQMALDQAAETVYCAR